MAVRIIGTGSCVPDKILTNEDLERLVDTSDAWITERTGIRSRRIAGNGTADMAVRAAERALVSAAAAPEAIGLLVVATSTGDCLFPNTACQVQAALRASRAVCFDLSAACSGFLFALSTAAAYLETGAYDMALVVGADTLSRIIDWKDRSTCVLFGDGAGAAVLRRESMADAGSGIGPFVLGSDGLRGGCLTCCAGPGTGIPGIPEKLYCLWDNKNAKGEEPARPYLTMNGQEVFRFAVKIVPEVIGRVLEQAELSPEDIKYFILHQANRRIIEAAAKRMKQPLSKFPMNLEKYGNTSGASIPLLLDELNREGRLKRGDRLVLAGFGAGLTWGAAAVQW